MDTSNSNTSSSKKLTKESKIDVFTISSINVLFFTLQNFSPSKMDTSNSNTSSSKKLTKERKIYVFTIFFCVAKFSSIKTGYIEFEYFFFEEVNEREEMENRRIHDFLFFASQNYPPSKVDTSNGEINERNGILTI